jgi:hypothetical protein
VLALLLFLMAPVMLLRTSCLVQFLIIKALGGGWTGGNIP